MPLNAELEATPVIQTDRKRWQSWFAKTSFAVSEQALIAGSNFLLNILVVRWLSAEQYGAYAIVFAIYMLLIGFYQGLILEPMAVLSASLEGDSFRDYLGSLLRVQVWVAATLSGGLLLVVGLMLAFNGKNQVAWSLLALVPSLPCILVFWLLRGACYIKRRPQDATQAAFIYSGVMLLSLFLTRLWIPMSSFLVFLVMGASAASVSLFLAKKLRPNLKSPVSDRQQWIDHWRFGRWELSKIGFDWIYQNVSYTLTAGFLGMVQVGAWKAILTLFLPLTQTMSALRRLILPHLASSFDHKGMRSTVNVVLKMSLWYGLGGLAYAAIVSLAAKPLFQILYAGKFMEYAYLVPWAGVAMLFGLPGHVIDMALRAIRSPQSIFVVSCLSTIACVLITVPLCWAFGISGAAYSLAISSSIMLLIISCVFWRKSRTLPQSESASVS